jgi:hypothetical protein
MLDLSHLQSVIDSLKLTASEFDSQLDQMLLPDGHGDSWGIRELPVPLIKKYPDAIGILFIEYASGQMAFNYIDVKNVDPFVNILKFLHNQWTIRTFMQSIF